MNMTELSYKPFDIRRVMSKLGKQMQDTDSRMSIRDLMAMSHRISRSTIFPKGGVVFEQWFFQYGKKALVRQVRPNERISQRSALWQKILSIEGPPFYVHVVETVKRLSNKNTRQLFFFTLMLDFRGLSRQSLIQFGQTDMCLKRQTFLNLLEKHHAVIRQQNERMIIDCPGVFWYDNFSKYYGRAYVARDVDSVIQANFTAAAFSRLPENSKNVLEENFETPPTGEYILRLMYVDRVSEALETVGFVRPEEIEYFEVSWAVQNNILTPNVNWHDLHEDDDPNDYTSLLGLENFVGFDVVDYNISSDNGLLHVLRDFFQMVEQQNPRRLNILKADQNIYWRLMLVSFT